MIRVAIGAAAMFLAAAALAEPPASLDEWAKQLATGYQRVMPFEAGTATVIRVQAVGTTVIFIATVKESSRDFDANRQALLTRLCRPTTSNMDFLAAGGKIQWVLQFADGRGGEVTLTRDNCAPDSALPTPASRDELKGIVALAKPKLPLTLADGLVLKDVTLDLGTQITYEYSMEKMVSQDVAARLQTDNSFLLRMSRQLKEKCNSTAIRTMLQRGVTYTHRYQAYGMPLYSGTLTKESCE